MHGERTCWTMWALVGATALGVGCKSEEQRWATGAEESGDATSVAYAPAYAGKPARRDYEGEPGEAALPPDPDEGTEDYTDYGARPFVETGRDTLSTFSVDVDTGSYTITRRKLREGLLPPAASVRVEEFVNYFRQKYGSPSEGPFAVVSEAAPSPFRQERIVLRVGLQGRRLDALTRKRANLVFLVDTSGSMQSPDKIGLVKESLKLLVQSLRADDRVSICTYAGHVELVLPPTQATDRRRILQALDRLSAGGSTAMSSGIDLAYELASREAESGSNTRVIVCSDGDANVGPSSHHEILRTIEGYRDRGITLGTVGFGMGNYKDTMMEQLANKGNGSYAYVDGLSEARRLFCEELVQNLEVIARDVKIQVAFDPERVRRYRLIGYENRAIHDDDFRDDKVDAGEVGAGHTVTALYEVDLVSGSDGPLGELRLRWKDGEPRQGLPDAAHEQAFSLTAHVHPEFAAASQRFRFTACVAEFAEILRRSQHTGTPLRALLPLLEDALDPGFDDREHELLELVERAEVLLPRGT